ncbi:keywimysin-related RiPP [Actinosynnema sp. NPDC050436]
MTENTRQPYQRPLLVKVGRFRRDTLGYGGSGRDFRWRRKIGN